MQHPYQAWEAHKALDYAFYFYRRGVRAWAKPSTALLTPRRKDVIFKAVSIANGDYAQPLLAGVGIG